MSIIYELNILYCAFAKNAKGCSTNLKAQLCEIVSDTPSYTIYGHFFQL